MKVIIPSKGRAVDISTHKLFDDYIIVLHDEVERTEYLKNKTIDPKKIVVSNVPYGISNQRQWILNNLVEAGEWFITADDNIKELTGVTGENYEKPVFNKDDPDLKDIFNSGINQETFMKVCKEMTDFADRYGIYYCGFAVVDNAYFRVKKYRYVGYVISKLALIKKTPLIDYDLKIQAMDDYGYTAENLKIFGRVLINNYIFPVANHYQIGGIGTYEERKPKKIADAKYLMNKYPGLFRYKKKVGCDPKAEIQVRFTNPKQVNLWRKNLLEVGKW